MSSELASSKVVILEEAPALRAIPSASTSVAGAIGVAQRGPIGQAVRCTSFEDFQQKFGGFTTRGDLALAAMSYFDNGGTTLWVVRTAHYTDPADASTLSALPASGLVRGAPIGGGAELDLLAVQSKDPGSYGNHLQLEVRAPSSGAANTFDLAVIEDGRYREVFADLSMDRRASRYVENIVNAPRGSAYVRVTDLDATSLKVPRVQVVSLANGEDGLASLNDRDFLGTRQARNGLHALDRIQDLATVFIPGRATPAVHQELIRYCEADRDGAVFAVLDPPAGLTAQGIVEHVEQAAGLLGLSEHGAIYWPRITVPNPAPGVFGPADSVVAPPSGAIAGVFARNDAARPGGVYDPPAGIDKGRLSRVTGFETDEVLEERTRDLVYPKRINPLTTAPGQPRYIDGSRTLKGDGNFPFIAERRGVSFIETSLKAGLEFARHRNNDEFLQAEVKRTITGFLIAQMQNGAFRSRVAESAFFVDLSGNTPDVVFAGKLIARVGLATNKPAEFIVIRISQDTRDLEAALAAASGV